MIQSMTGFVKAIVNVGNKKITAEIISAVIMEFLLSVFTFFIPYNINCYI